MGGHGRRWRGADGGGVRVGWCPGGMACEAAVGVAINEDLRLELAVARDAMAALAAYCAP